MRSNQRVTVLTAAMCQGNKLEKVRDEFPERFFDTGICEAHTVAFAAGQAKVGMRPIVDIYSTFLQRAYDQIFQEVALQNLPVTFMLDRGGLAGPDGPTHHGVFDLGYLRVFPNMVVMAPGDAHDLPAMLEFALQHDGPCAIRYPKATGRTTIAEREAWTARSNWAAAKSLAHGCRRLPDRLWSAAVPTASKRPRYSHGEGLDVGVINARFLKPLDTETIFRALERMRLRGDGRRSGPRRWLRQRRSRSGRRRRPRHQPRPPAGIPDHYVEHGERDELLADLGLDVAGIAAKPAEHWLRPSRDAVDPP